MPHRPDDVICFGSDWYSASVVSIRQMVEELHGRGARVLWINPVPVRFPSARGRDFMKKVSNKARTHARFLSRQGDGLYVYSPLYLPLYKGPGFFINRVALTLQVLVLRLLLGMRRPLVMGSAFTAWFGLPAVRGLPFVFHFADKISAFREVSDVPERRRILEDMEREIVRAADLCTCSSRAIQEHVASVAGAEATKAVLLPHAVKAHAFLQEDAPRALPRELADLPRPIAGYFGSLTQTNDQATFLHAARALPDWSFVFIGKVLGDYAELESLPNVHFLGPRPHAEIPAYGAAFDVCFMGWRAHEWITNCFPLKTLEYLALEKPVVCAGRIDEVVERFPDLVRTTGSPEEFTAALAEEVAADGPQPRQRRREAVRSETWAHRIDTILIRLADLGAGHAT